MFAALYIPGWLYLIWPWLCLAMAVAYLCIGGTIMAAILLAYAGWTLWRRSRVMEYIRRAHWQRKRWTRINHGT